MNRDGRGSFTHFGTSWYLDNATQPSATNLSLHENDPDVKFLDSS